MNNPLVTVNILSFNRTDELRITLTKVFEQDYKNIEVIVVDNASTDGSPEMVERKFPNVTLIKLTKNIGIKAFQYTMEKANGEYYLILDDDSYPEKTALTYGITFLETKPEYGIVTFKIFNKRTNEIETKYFKHENPYLFHGCGSIWRKEVYQKLGGYDSDFFLYYNELDLTIRCYDNGMKIRYLSEKLIFHQNTELTSKKHKVDYHKNSRKYEQYFTGHIRFLIKHFKLKYVIIYGIKWTINRLIVAFFFNYYISFIKSIIVLPRVVMQSLKKRNPVNLKVQRYYRNGNISLIDRDFFLKFRKFK